MIARFWGSSQATAWVDTILLYVTVDRRCHRRPWCPQSAVLPSMSVKRKVTVPVGNSGIEPAPAALPETRLIEIVAWTVRCHAERLRWVP
jgi:hypothetical protein